MTFLAPVWLFALVPWAVFAGWMLVGRRRRQGVPFLELWEAPEELRKPKKGWEPPPLALVAALLATLLGVLAMAQPVLTPPGRLADRGRITIVVDRGASMSALTGGQARFLGSARAVAPKLLEAFGPGAVRLVDPIDGGTDEVARSTWVEVVSGWKRTDVDTAAALRATVQPLLERGEPVVLLSDRDLGLAYDQLVQVKPRTPVQNAGIVALAARPGQVMVAVRATQALRRSVRLRSGDREVTKPIDLEAGAAQHVFVDFDAPTDLIEAALVEADEFDADDRAWLVRSRPWPGVEARLPLTDELRRMLDVYARHRPASESSVVVALARPGELKSDQAGVLLPAVSGAESARGAVQSSPHAILAGVDFVPLARAAALSATGPGEGWAVVVKVGGRPVVAVRDGERRQVWIGFESREFARTPSFVVFWTNVLDWAGAGGDGFTSNTIDSGALTGERVLPDRLPNDVDPVRWPGVFETAQGRVARNSNPVSFASGTEAWAARLPRLHLPRGNGIELTRWLALIAIACLALAAATWERRRPTVPRPQTHLDVEAVIRVQTTFEADGHVHRHETTTRP